MVELPDFSQTPWLLDADLRAILELLGGQAQRSRVVGGLVRDTILGLPLKSSDIDIATELTPDVVVARAEAAGMAHYPTGIAHGTVTLRRGSLVAEVTTLREDVATDGRHAEVRFGHDWRRDAERRDFTLNALYVDLDGGLLDPVGGLEDCLARRVRFIGEAARRIEEDRLRVYRFFRFSASHGGERFDADGLAACRQAAGTLDRVSAERVGGEMLKLLSLPRCVLTLQAMSAAGILAIEETVLAQLAAYERRADAATRTGRLAILAGEGGLVRLQEAWRLSNAEIDAAREVLSAWPLLAAGKLHEAAYRHPQALSDAANLVVALEDWPVESALGLFDEMRALHVPAFPIGGGDLKALGWPAGPGLGQKLASLERDWIASGFALTREDLLAAAGPGPR